MAKSSNQTKMATLDVGETISHTLDFVAEEDDGNGILVTKQQVVRAGYDPRACVFVFDWNIILNAKKRLPERLGNLLLVMKKLGFQMIAILPFNARELNGATRYFDRVYVQQEEEDSNAVFIKLYKIMGDSNVIFFGGEELMMAVIDQRKENDVFTQVESNPDKKDGNPSYLEEILAMVLVVQAGKEITSSLLGT